MMSSLILAMSLAVTQTAPVAPPTFGDRPVAEILTNQSVIALAKAGLGPDAIVAKIMASQGNYNTSSEALIELKNAGVPDAAIAAVVKRSTSPAANDDTHPNPLVSRTPGIYLLNSGASTMRRLSPTSSNQVKTSNFWGYRLTAGLSSMKKKLVIPKASAGTVSGDRLPTFYFYFGQTGTATELAGFASNLPTSASSPNEFTLLRLDQKAGHREATIASINIIEQFKSGVGSKERMSFTASEIAPSIFRVVPDYPLEPGQYAFMSSIAASTDRDVVARIFDFAIE